MKIGFISDTHGDIEQVKKALDLLKDSDEIWHIGDVLYHGPRNDLPAFYNPKDLAVVLKDLENILFVKGNCDSDVDEMVIEKDLQQKSRVEERDGVTFFLVHGYEETQKERIERAKKEGAQVVVTGHTHIKELEEKEGVVLLNPGSTTIPKDGSASVAYYEKGKLALLNLETGEEIRELKIK